MRGDVKCVGRLHRRGIDEEVTAWGDHPSATMALSALVSNFISSTTPAYALGLQLHYEFVSQDSTWHSGFFVSKN